MAYDQLRLWALVLLIKCACVWGGPELHVVGLLGTVKHYLIWLLSEPCYPAACYLPVHYLLWRSDGGWTLVFNCFSSLVTWCGGLNLPLSQSCQFQPPPQPRLENSNSDWFKRKCLTPIDIFQLGPIQTCEFSKALSLSRGQSISFYNKCMELNICQRIAKNVYTGMQAF